MSESSSDELDTQGFLLAVNNAVAAIIHTHPTPQALRRVLEYFNNQQAKSFGHGDPEPKLVEAYEHYSANLMAAVPAKPISLNADVDLNIKFK